MIRDSAASGLRTAEGKTKVKQDGCLDFLPTKIPVLQGKVVGARGLEPLTPVVPNGVRYEAALRPKRLY